MKDYLFLLFVLTQFTIYSQENMKKDWPNFKKYATENESISTSPSFTNTIVFMGDSITEFWKVNDPDFFSSNIVRAVPPNSLNSSTCLDKFCFVVDTLA